MKAFGGNKKIKRRWPALGMLCVAQFVVVLDVTIVAIALPEIQVDLGFSQAGLQWVISAYTLVFGGFLLLAGRAADLWGRRRLFMIGLVVFSGVWACEFSDLAGGGAHRAGVGCGDRGSFRALVADCGLP
jgi:MFS family permease